MYIAVHIKNAVHVQSYGTGKASNLMMDMRESILSVNTKLTSGHPDSP